LTKINEGRKDAEKTNKAVFFVKPIHSRIRRWCFIENDYYSVNEERKSISVEAHLRKHRGRKRREGRSEKWRLRESERMDGWCTGWALDAAFWRLFLEGHASPLVIGIVWLPLFRTLASPPNAAHTRTAMPKETRREAHLSSRHRKRDSLKHETLLVLKRCRAICEDGNARSETRFLHSFTSYS